MSVEKITKAVYHCTCELKGCGKSWDSDTDLIPERCRWCGRRTWNGQDLRKNSFITVDGKTQRISEWSRESNISAPLIRYRIKMGWPEKDAVSIPPAKPKGAI
jgi:hypothetical protein